MKHLKEKDLSLDKQEVSALGGSNGTKGATDGCPNPTVQTTLDSHNPPCCPLTDDCNTCGETCEFSKCINCTETETCPGTKTCPQSDDCTVTNDETTCAVSVDNETGCIIPIPETKLC